MTSNRVSVPGQQRVVLFLQQALEIPPFTPFHKRGHIHYQPAVGIFPQIWIIGYVKSGNGFFGQVHTLDHQVFWVHLKPKPPFSFGLFLRSFNSAGQYEQHAQNIIQWAPPLGILYISIPHHEQSNDGNIFSFAILTVWYAIFYTLWFWPLNPVLSKKACFVSIYLHFTPEHQTNLSSVRNLQPHLQ